MREIEELRDVNARMAESLKQLEHAIQRVEIALIGDKFTDAGLIKRLDNVEDKLKKLDKYMWMLVGMFSLGTIPIGMRVLPFIKDYLK